MTPAQLTPSPDDWRDTVIYQVLTDRFWDGDPSNNDANPTGNRGVMGGDFVGLMERLDHIEGLGCNAIWISPVSTNVRGAYHGYHAFIWDEIDPHWGTEEELRALVDACHERGIRVFFDIICNHMGDLIDSAAPDYPDHSAQEYAPRWSGDLRYPPPFDDLSMFQIHGRPTQWDGPVGETAEIFGLDDLRTTDPRVRDYLVDLWVDMVVRFDVDGFRIDTVKHVELEFWEEWAPRLRERLAAEGKEDFLMFGEVWLYDPERMAPYAGPLDSVTDFARQGTTHAVFAEAAAGPVSLERHWDSVTGAFDIRARDRLVTFLDNHDMNRFLHDAQRAASPEHERGADRLHAALVYHLTAPGIPTIYYGTEIGFTGGEGFLGGEGRLPMWEEDGTDHFDLTNPTAQLIAALNRFRQAQPALRRGDMTFLRADPEPGILAYRRSLEGEPTVTVAINTDPDATHTVEIEGHAPIDLAPMEWWVDPPMESD